MLENARKWYLALSNQQHVTFLVLMCFRVSEIARGSYLEADNTTTASIKALRAYNEVMQVLSKQLLVALAVWPQGAAYPREVFFDILEEKIKPGECYSDFAHAVATVFDTMNTECRCE